MQPKFLIHSPPLLKRRPGSGQPITVTSPPPPRKAVYSGKERTENTNIQHRVLKQLTPSITQSQLHIAKSPPKEFNKKPPLDKKTLNKIDGQGSSIFKRTLVHATGQGTPLTSPTQQQPQKLFNWRNQVELVVTQQDIANKRKSAEKLIQLQQSKVDPPKRLQNGRKFVVQKNLVNNQSQPKCFTDFSMTSGRHDLQNVFASIKTQISAAIKQQEMQPNLNMSKIEEQSDDASSLAQSHTFNQ